jgi:hypothetical protein
MAEGELKRESQYVHGAVLINADAWAKRLYAPAVLQKDAHGRVAAKEGAR